MKEFIDKTYGGVASFFENEVDEMQHSEVTIGEVNSKSIEKNTSTFKVVVPRPSQDELQKYIKVWDTLENYSLQENALEKLFHRTYPNNTDIENVLIKVSTLNDFYSTNIFSPFRVAKHVEVAAKILLK